MNTFVYRKRAALLGCHVQMYASAAIGWHGKDRQVTLPACLHRLGNVPHCCVAPYNALLASACSAQGTAIKTGASPTQPHLVAKPPTAAHGWRQRCRAGTPHCRWRATISPAVSTLAAQGLGKPADGPSEEASLPPAHSKQ